MKIEPEAGSLIGPSVSPAQLKLGTIQWVFFGRESSVVMSSSYFAHYKHCFSPPTLLLYAPPS